MNPHASAIWRGNRNEGSGTLSTESDVLSETPYSFEAGVGTTPEELVAAALVGCFSISLAKELALAGFHPERIDTTVTATVNRSESVGMISHCQLDVRAKVLSGSQDEFVRAALAAKKNSPIARLLSTTISMTAHLEVD